MKRKKLLQQLNKLGFEIREGGKHSGIYKDGKPVSTLPRHSEISERTVKEIEKQLGVRFE